MAYIYKRGDKWAYRAYAGKDPTTGKDKQKSKSGFRTKKDAQLAASLFERQFHKGEYIQPSPVTFSDLCEEWEKQYKVDVKESSVRARTVALKHMINEFGDLPIQRITKQQYQALINKLAEHFSHSYLSGIHTSANMVFEYAYENKLISSVPTERIKTPKKKKTIEDIENESFNKKFLEKEELNEFLMVAKNEGLEGDLTCFTLLAYTGIRIGELIVLDWDDIDFDNHTLHIYKTYFNATNKKSDYQIFPPKTEKSVRTISIDPVVVDLLKQHKRKQDKLKEGNAAVYHDENFVFTTNDGYPRTVKHYNMRMSRILERTSIKKKVTPHSLRHTHTALLIESNAHIKEIQERLGHSSYTVTMNIYAHLTKDMKQEASSRFSNLMQDLSKDISNQT